MSAWPVYLKRLATCKCIKVFFFFFVFAKKKNILIFCIDIYIPKNSYKKTLIIFFLFITKLYNHNHTDALAFIFFFFI